MILPKLHVLKAVATSLLNSAGMLARDNQDWDIVVIGAGIAGLTAAALLAAENKNIIVLERHNVAGGCASFFQEQGFRFDVGATVAGGFGPRGLHRRIFEKLAMPLDVQPLEPAMIVHIDTHQITRWGDTRWKQERLRHFGPQAEAFWQKQESVADRAWELAASLPAVPVDVQSLWQIMRHLKFKDFQLLNILGRSVDSIMPDIPLLRRFVDAQLLITAQTDAKGADLLYGLTALDLAREGVFHLPDGLSSIALHLAKALRQHGGQIRYRTEVTGIRLNAKGVVQGVTLLDGQILNSPLVISAIPLADTNRLLPTQHQLRLAPTSSSEPQWGAFMAYIGLPAHVVPQDFALHHQILATNTTSLGEGNTVFLSFSADGEIHRSRSGGRAVTISTHTDIREWQSAWQQGQYQEKREQLGRKLLASLDQLLPNASQFAELIRFATPHTFEHFTGRGHGKVGGPAQRPWVANVTAPSHRTNFKGLLLCGDSIFPGQSTVGASHSAVVAAQHCLGYTLLG